MAAAAQLLDLDAVVVEVVHHHGRRLVLLVSVAQRASIEHGASRTPGEHVALVAESGRVVVAADDLLDREPLQRGNQRWVIHLGMSVRKSGEHRRRDPDRIRRNHSFPTYTRVRPLF